ncbi:MAG: histidine phosphatase family protein [Anaerolineae bacterium]|nr:histidine phosphatase family protein [Anaerolineae bacterium]
MPVNQTDNQTLVYLVRHGETDGNVLRRWAGQNLDPLNPAGRQQAQRAAARLAHENIDVLYSSDSVRTMQTAQVVAAVTGLEIRPDARLRELDIGVWQGHTTHEIETLDGENLARFWADPFHNPPPGGETFYDQINRVEAAFNEITAAHLGARIAIVTHGGSIVSLLSILKGRKEEPAGVNLANASVTVLAGAPGADGAFGAWKIALLNDVTHLQEPE